MNPGQPGGPRALSASLLCALMSTSCAPPARPAASQAAPPPSAAPALAASSPAIPSPLWARRATHYTLRLPVPLPGVVGLSDLARDDAGRYWAIEERAPSASASSSAPFAPTSEATRELVRLDLSDPSHPRVAERFRFTLPLVLDAESVAPLGGNRFAIGTEVQREHASEGNQTADVVFAVSVDGATAHVDPTAGWELSYAPWHLHRDPNHGIEGMCATARWVLMASEQRVDEPHTFAPLVLRDRRTSSTTSGKLFLEHEGRISALTCCDSADGGLDVTAIQRGLLPGGRSVHRLLSFHVAPAATAPLDATPDVDVDLEPLWTSAGGKGLMPNLEGLAPLDASSLALITDDSPQEGAQLLVLTAAP